MSSFKYHGITTVIEGAVFKADPTSGQYICVDPGRTVWSDAWPEPARVRIAELERQIADLRSALLQQAKGQGGGDET